MSYPVRSSETVFVGKIFRVHVDHVLHPRGHEMRLELIDHPGAVAILPIDEDERIWFVRQYRHATGERLLELPAGTREPGEPAQECVRRECREEIGMAPGTVELLGSAFLAPGYSSELIEFYLARDLVHAPLTQDADEDIAIESLPLRQAFEMLAAGQLYDAKTIAGLTLGLCRLGRLGLTSPS